MKNLVLTAMTAGALSAAALGFAGAAGAAPSGPSSVDQTVGQLKSEGYTVVVNKLGNGSQCSVTGVRPGQTYSQPAPGDPVTTVAARTVYVEVKC